MIKNNRVWKFISQRLQLKMILVVVLALLIPTMVIGTYSISVTTDQVLRTAEEKDLQFVKTQAAAALRFLTEGERDTLFVSQSPATRRFVGTLAGTDDSSTEVLLASQLKLFLKATPDYLSVRILDISGKEVFGMDNRSGSVAVTPNDQLDNQASQLYFIETLRLAGPVYISDVELNTTANRIDTPLLPIIRFTLPLYAESGGIAGVIVIKALAQPLLQADSVNTANDTLYIIDENGDYLSHLDPAMLYGNILKTGITFAQDRPHDGALIRTANEGTIFTSQDRPDLLQSFVTVDLPGRDDAHWTFLFEEKQSQVLSQINNARLVIVGLVGLALLIALGLAILITRSIVLPVQQLARVSVSISRGEWDVAIPAVDSGDEISKLALAFDRMSKELRTLYDKLEMRVIARTSELETVAKVSAAAAAILDLDKLLQTTSELTRDSFGLSKVQVYLLDVSGQNLVLAGLSDQGSILLASSESVVAVAGRTRNLPEQRKDAVSAELAVPLMVANKLLGVLDLHSEQPDRFTEPELRVMTILAAQIAVAVQNASLYKEQLTTTQQLVIARQRAEEANKAKSLFLSNMSHELRTPLNIVIGYTSSMLERPSMYDNLALPPVYANDIKLIRDNGYHLIGLINDILDLSKIEAGKLELVREPMALNDIFRGVLATSVGLVKDKPVLIKSDVPDQLPTVYADPIRVRQIILNLMSNAVKFTERGSVTLRASVEADGIKIAVSDTGIGIPEKALAHIFDRFQQVSHDTSRIYGGTGLGLDISKQLCQMHGGDLLVESVYGKGSTFTFTLPLLTAEQMLSSRDSAGVPQTSQVFAPTHADAPPSTILLVEDEMTTTDFMRRTLESAGYFVLATAESVEAADMVLALLPDMILLDIELQGGWTLLDTLKSESDTAAIPVILCAAYDDHLHAPDTAITLRKPFTAQELLQAVEQARQPLPR